MTFKELLEKKGLTPVDAQKICQVRSLKTIYNWINNDNPKPLYRKAIEEYKSKR